jgi:hypothetical protein
MTQTLLPPPRMTVAPSLIERCDRCGAAGKLGLTLADGGELVFCGHHANQHTEDILRTAVSVTVEEGFDWWWGADRASR